MEIKFISIIILFFFVKARDAVKINQVSVPSFYLENDKNEALILDCDFDVNKSEKKFVLKWLHNSVLIYQWIPPAVPYVLGSFKDRVNPVYSASEDEYKKYSALAIKKPSISDTGNYTCYVQTFQSFDKKTAQMIVVHPEQSINIKYSIDDVQQSVNIECSVYNIYPLPEVKLLFDNEEKDFSIEMETPSINNLYNVTITTQISKTDIKDDSSLTCLVRINDTDYENKKTIIYDDPKQTSTSKISIDGENMFASQLNDENHGMFFKPQIGIFIIVLLNYLLGRVS